MSAFGTVKDRSPVRAAALCSPQQPVNGSARQQGRSLQSLRLRPSENRFVRTSQNQTSPAPPELVLVKTEIAGRPRRTAARGELHHGVELIKGMVQRLVRVGRVEKHTVEPRSPPPGGLVKQARKSSSFWTSPSAGKVLTSTE